MKLLLAEDEVDMSEALVDILTFHKYTVDAVYDGEEAYDYASLGNYDGIILDIMMPKKDGLTVLKELRKEGCQTPILMLTAKSEIEDKVAGLDLGADDYLAKPFSMDELLARLRAMLRRREKSIATELTCGNVSLNQQTFELKVKDEGIILPKLEFQVMEMFMLNQDMYISADNILEKVWGYDTDAEISTVWVYISYLRKKLAQLGADVEIQAKRNIGYRLEKK
ncbi:MAG: response regulator transcription factor [Lachnospiraceae bacterium]|nr:response regulator transcription factor [Lachnospiraceae bacterium]